MPLLLPLLLSLFNLVDQSNDTCLHLLFKGHTLMGIFINGEERKEGREGSRRKGSILFLFISMLVFSTFAYIQKRNVHTCIHTQQTSFPFHHPPNFASFSYTIFLCKCIDPFIGTRSDAFKATL